MICSYPVRVEAKTGTHESILFFKLATSIELHHSRSQEEEDMRTWTVDTAVLKPGHGPTRPTTNARQGRSDNGARLHPRSSREGRHPAEHTSQHGAATQHLF